MGWLSWPFWSSDSKKGSAEAQRDEEPVSRSLIDSQTCDKLKSAWSSPTRLYDLSRYLSPENVISTVLVCSTLLAGRGLYRLYFRRLSVANDVPSKYFEKQRTLFGVVTRVGDGDGFRLFHTPGGRLAGWGWLPGRKIPSGKALKDQTISIRLAGVDAPENAHFGKPAQPGGPEALAWLTDFLVGKRVRCYIYKKDQYDRLVASVKVRRFGGLWRQDVGLVMLKQGLATVYEAKTGAVFGGAKMEEKYRRTEWWAKTLKRGIWKNQGDGWESPREFKTRTGIGTDPIERDKN